MQNQLQTIVQESGLEQTKAKYILEKFQDSFELASEWEEKAKHIVVFDEHQKADMKLARTGRLILRAKRLSIEKSRKELKEQSLREGKAIDGIANVLKALIIPTEEYLNNQEKFVEIQEAKKQEAKRLEVEKRIEEDRTKEEEREELEKQRYYEAVVYKQFWKVDNPDFQNMTEETFQKCMVALKERKQIHDDKQMKILAENEKLRKENVEKDRKHKKEKEAREKKMAVEVELERIAQLKIDRDRQAKQDIEDNKQKAIQRKLKKEKEEADAEATRLKEQLENQKKTNKDLFALIKSDVSACICRVVSLFDKKIIPETLNHLSNQYTDRIILTIEEEN